MGAPIIPRRGNTESDTRPCSYFFATGLFVVGRGVHPHCDGKSPEAIEDKGVAGVHCLSRVRKLLEIKELNDADSEQDEGRERDWGIGPGWSLANTRKDSMPVRIG